jgi:hypothetical protein
MSQNRNTVRNSVADPGNIELFTQKIVNKLLKIWVWDPGSEIREKPIPDPGSRGQKGTGVRIRICNTGQEESQNGYQGESRLSVNGETGDIMSKKSVLWRCYINLTEYNK